MKLSLMTFFLESNIISGAECNASKMCQMKEVLAKASEAGFELVDMMYPTMELLGSENIHEILQEYHLKLNCLIAMGTAESKEKEVEVMKTAERFGCKMVMLVPGRIEGEKEELAGRFLQSFSDYVEEAKKYGITCVIEDDPWIKIPLCTREEMKYYFEHLPELKMVFDTANMLVLNEDPVEYYRTFEFNVHHMHVKDMRYETQAVWDAEVSVDGKYMTNAPHFEGVVNFDALFKEFAISKYDGTMALEYVPREDMEYGEDFKRLYERFTQLQIEYGIA